jgi:hypothetical protein
MSHYFLYGETPEETVRWRSTHTRRKRKSKWDETDSDYLRQILNEHPEYYLDEIQIHMSYRSGKWFSGKTLYRHMRDIGFTLKVAYEKSKQRDEEERASWRLFLQQLGPNVEEQILFIDETHKSLKEMRRRRHWVMKGKIKYYICLGHICS